MKEQMSMKEYNEHVKKMNILRWCVVVMYVILTVGLGFLPLIYPVDELAFVVGYNVIVFGGMILLVAVLLYPFLKKADMPVVEDGKLLEGILDPKDLPEVYHEKIRVFLIFELMVPILLFMAVFTAWSFVYMDMFWGFFNAGFTVLFVVLLIFFGHLDVTATKRYLHFHYGPIGKVVTYDEIKSIRSTSVHAFRDFMGWGLRMGPDGTWGYIASGKVGVRVTLKNDKQYVITVRDPETLVAYVRARRKEAVK